MSTSLVEGIVNERTTDFMGKDGMQWWIGEVEDNKDPLQINRVKCRVLGWYTNISGGQENASAKLLTTADLPWAIVLQPTTQAGNDGQGESSGQLQPGAVVMGFFLDGEEAQMPVVMGVLRVVKSTKGGSAKFIFTGENNSEAVDAATATNPNVVQGDGDKGPNAPGGNNSVAQPGSESNNKTNGPSPANPGSSVEDTVGIGLAADASLGSQPINAANGVGGPHKAIKMHFTSMLERIGKIIAGSVKADGGYTSIASGVFYTMEQITAEVKNALSAIGAEVVSALRELLNKLAGMLTKGGALIASFTGIPTATLILIKQVIMFILSQLCIIDAQLLNFVNAPMAALNALIESLVGKAIDFVNQALDKLLASITAQIQAMLCKVKGIVAIIEALVAGIGAAKAILDAWKKGSKIFADGFDLKKLTFEDWAALVLFLFNLFDLGCGRIAQQASDTKGFVPFLGATACEGDTLEAMMDTLGAVKCAQGTGSFTGKGETGAAAISFIKQIYRDASPFLTKIRNEPNGAAHAELSTPGRNMSVQRFASGTSFYSIKMNDAAYQKFKNKSEAYGAKAFSGDKGPQVDGKEQNDKANKTSQAKDKPTIGDHSEYAAAYTMHVAKDYCRKVVGDEVVTVSGDYHLKVGGDLHIEVGGALLLTASGAPKQVQKDGKTAPGNKAKAQKHSIKFESDVDIYSVGAELLMQGTGVTINGMDTKLGAPSGTLSLDSPSINIRGGDIVLSASNTITEACGTLMQNINMPIKPRAKSGIFCVSAGPVDYKLIPAPSFDPLPRFQIDTVGPFIVNCAAAGASFKVAAGVFDVKVLAGAINMDASAAVSIKAGAAMSLTAAANVTIKGATINLN